MEVNFSFKGRFQKHKHNNTNNDPAVSQHLHKTNFTVLFLAIFWRFLQRDVGSYIIRLILDISLLHGYVYSVYSNIVLPVENIFLDS